VPEKTGQESAPPSRRRRLRAGNFQFLPYVPFLRRRRSGKQPRAILSLNRRIPLRTPPRSPSQALQNVRPTVVKQLLLWIRLKYPLFPLSPLIQPPPSCNAFPAARGVENRSNLPFLGIGFSPKVPLSPPLPSAASSHR